MQEDELVRVYNFLMYCLGLYGEELYAIAYGFLLRHGQEVCRFIFMILLYIILDSTYQKFKQRKCTKKKTGDA